MTGCPWRCVAVSTISRQAQKSVLYTRRNWAFTPKPYYHPFRVRSLHPFSRTGTYRRRTIVESRRGPILRRGNDYRTLLCLATPPTFSLSALFPSTHPPNRPTTPLHSRTRAHAPILLLCPSLFLRRSSKWEFRSGGDTAYIRIIYVYIYIMVVLRTITM